MNNNFELILENNKEFIITLNKIVSDLKNNELSFWYDTQHVLNPTTFYEDLKSKLKNKKYKGFFNDIFCLPGEYSSCIYMVDNNRFTWMLELNNNDTIEVKEITKVFLESKIIIRYEKNMSMICKDEANIKALFDLTKNNLTLNEAEIIYLTTDIDLKPLIEYSADKVIISNVNGISFKEAYEKKGIIKKIFNV